MAEARKLVARARKVSYLNTGTSEVPVWSRMRGFTSLSKSKEAMEYSRQYVDEYFETTDTVGMSEGIGFEFDQYVNDPVHTKVAKIFNDELVGDDANVEILTVDYSPMLSVKAEGPMPENYEGVKRTYSVIPDSEGDGTESYKYTGTFKAKTSIEKVKVTAKDNDKSITVTTATVEI